MRTRRNTAILAFAALSSVCSIGCDSRGTKQESEPDPERLAISDRFFEASAGEPIFFIRSRLAEKEWRTFDFQKLPSGAVRFYSALDKKQYVTSPPFEIREGKYPEFERDKISENQRRELEEAAKYYLILTNGSTGRRRYSAFRYEISTSGGLEFWDMELRRTISLSPPYVIEEMVLANGVKPYGPGFTQPK